VKAVYRLQSNKSHSLFRILNTKLCILHLQNSSSVCGIRDFRPRQDRHHSVTFYENARYTFSTEFVPEYKVHNIVLYNMCTRMTPIGLINASMRMPLGPAALDSA